MMPNTLDEINTEQESGVEPNSLVANLNELSSMNDFNKNLQNKPVIRTELKTPFFYPNPPPHMPFFPNQPRPNYQFFNPYQFSAKNFYSINMFNKPVYQDRRTYLKVKKEQNMHKLWPHSAQNKLEAEAVNEQPVKGEVSQETETNCETNEQNDTQGPELNKKTPMCLVHELVKFNKIKHEYILLDEKGPAHKKTFYVELKLGAGSKEEESYQANGSSIKKAQHKAAETALNETKFAKPTPRVKPENSSKKIVATVQKENQPKPVQSNTVKLNSLCMKHGLKANYENIVTPVASSTFSSLNGVQIKPFVYQPPQVYAQNFGFNQAYRTNSNRAHRYTRFGIDGVSKVKLKLGNESFVAEGETVQKARHTAAALALDYLSNEENFKKVKEYFNKPVDSGTLEKFDQKKESSAAAVQNQESEIKILTREKCDQTASSGRKDTLMESLTNSKSEISILLELCLRLKKPITFELVNESGPSHIRKFVTKCSIGSKNSPNDEYFEVLGEGNSKKQSKQKSAIEMLNIIREKYPHTFESLYSKMEKETIKKAESKNSNEDKKKRKSKSNIIVANKTSPDYGSGTINPITRLIQIQQAKKEPEPIFELLSSVNTFRKNDLTKSRSEFCMRVSIWASKGVLVQCEGKGRNKKAAKQNAAEAMLVELGYPPVHSQPTQIKPVIKNSEENGEKSEKKVKFVDDAGEQGDQEYKSVIKIRTSVPNKIKLYKDQLSDRTCEVNVLLDRNELDVCSKIAKELVESIEKNEKDFYSKTAEDYLKQKNQGSPAISAKDFNETDHGKAKLKILTNGSEENYKAALDYLANIFNFKCNYQSILGRDKRINSYLSLSILSNTDKPFSGQGATRVHSSNLAAAAALNYLANNYKTL